MQNYFLVQNKICDVLLWELVSFFHVVSLFLKYFISDILFKKLGEISNSLILNLSQRLLPKIV